MATTWNAAKHAVADRVEPVVESLKGSAEQARRAIVSGQQAADDALMATAIRVRRRPLTSIAVAGAIGAALGCLAGIAVSCSAKRRT